MLLSMGGKNGSEKTRELSSHTTNAIDQVRRGAAERGAGSAHNRVARSPLRPHGGSRPRPRGSGEYPRRGRGETPACWATSASLGRNFVSCPTPQPPGQPSSVPGRLARRAIPQLAHCMSATRTSAVFRVRYGPATLCCYSGHPRPPCQGLRRTCARPAML